MIKCLGSGHTTVGDHILMQIALFIGIGHNEMFNLQYNAYLYPT